MNRKGIFNTIIERSIKNTKGCIIDTRELNRTMSMGETHRHKSKYAHSLTVNKLGLMENIQLLRLLHKDPTLVSTRSLTLLYKYFEQTDVSLKPYQKIEKVLQDMKL